MPLPPPPSWQLDMCFVEAGIDKEHGILGIHKDKTKYMTSSDRNKQISKCNLELATRTF